MLATGEAIRSTGEAFSPRVNMLDEALCLSHHTAARSHATSASAGRPPPTIVTAGRSHATTSRAFSIAIPTGPPSADAYPDGIYPVPHVAAGDPAAPGFGDCATGVSAAVGAPRIAATHPTADCPATVTASSRT